MIPARKRSSRRIVAPTGVWSVRTPAGYLSEGVEEGVAWGVFIHHPGAAVLLRGIKPIAERKVR
jgi:hypothetical protein